MTIKLRDLKSHRLYRFLNLKDLGGVYNKISMIFSQPPLESAHAYNHEMNEALKDQKLEVNHQIARSVAEVHRMKSFRM